MIVPIYVHSLVVRRYRHWDDPEPLPNARPPAGRYTFYPVPDSVKEDRENLFHTEIRHGEVPLRLIRALAGSELFEPTPDPKHRNLTTVFLRTPTGKVYDPYAAWMSARNNQGGLSAVLHADPAWHDPASWLTPDAPEPAPIPRLTVVLGPPPETQPGPTAQLGFCW